MRAGERASDLAGVIVAVAVFGALQWVGFGFVGVRFAVVPAPSEPPSVTIPGTPSTTRPQVIPVDDKLTVYDLDRDGRVDAAIAVSASGTELQAFPTAPSSPWVVYGVPAAATVIAGLLGVVVAGLLRPGEARPFVSRTRPARRNPRSNSI